MMMLRTLWVVVVLIVAGVTLAAQLDRQARVVPTIATSVPEPFRAFAQARIATAAIRGDDPQVAVTEARRLIERRPVPAEHLRLLAQAQIEAGDAEAGAYTIQIAAQRGWRDPLAQEAVMRFALAAGDEPEAARRYTALFLKNGTEDALLREIGTTLFETPDGPGAETLLEIVSGSDRWHDFFLRRGPRVLPAPTFAQIVIKAGERGSEFDCDVLEGTVRPVTRGNASAGAALAEFVESRC